MDFQALVNDTMTKYIEEKLPEHTEKHLEKMIDSILSDLFSSYGDKSKEIKKLISEKINIDLTRLSLVDYNGMIATAIQNNFIQITQENSVEPIMKLVTDIVGEKYPKTEITLFELLDEVKYIMENDAEHGDTGEVSFFAEYNKNNEWIECWTDDEADKEKRDCAVRFIFSKDKKRGSIFSIHFLSYSGAEKPTMDITRMGKVEKLIHKLWCSGVNITIDEDLEDGEIELDRHFEKYD